MNRLKQMLSSLHAQNRSRLCELYTDRHRSEKEKEEMPKLFQHHDLSFSFGGTSLREPEKLNLFVEIPSLLTQVTCDDTTALPIENYMLALIAGDINRLSAENVNTNKSSREQAVFEAQQPNQLMIKRNGLLYHQRKEAFVLKLLIKMPLINSASVNGKNGFKAVKSIIDLVHSKMLEFPVEECQLYIETYLKQQAIRNYLRSQHLSVFIADGSILPRENGTAQPQKEAIAFRAPETLSVTIPLPDHTTISGMGIPHGVTVITGGGYSGKSTLLDAIEMGIYNHIPGDGREYCLTDHTALKIYAEDGRPVHDIDLTPFFKHLPYCSDVSGFATNHASGSVSQATNIMESICGNSKLLLIDEDKSANNFMIRDENMRAIVKKDPIIPFTDRIRELHDVLGISTVLVIGGSSEYFRYADTIILMEDYQAYDRTAEIRTLGYSHAASPEPPAHWMKHRVFSLRSQ